MAGVKLEKDMGNVYGTSGGWRLFKGKEGSMQGRNVLSCLKYDTRVSFM